MSKVSINKEHIELMNSIMLSMLQVQSRGVVDTGPGGENAEQVTARLQGFNDMLLYWLQEGETSRDNPQKLLQGKKVIAVDDDCSNILILTLEDGTEIEIEADLGYVGTGYLPVINMTRKSG